MKDDVGYKKPPPKGKFKKGVSGNPKGRPKLNRDRSDGAISLMQVIEETMSQMTYLDDQGKRMRISLRQLAVKKLARNAFSSSDPKALESLLKWVEKADRAALEGRTGEPLRVIISGGLPDNDVPSPIHETEPDQEFTKAGGICG